MKVFRDISVVLMTATTLLAIGCSSFDSMFRSVGSSLGKKQSEIDAMVLEEARDAFQAENYTQAEELYLEFVDKNQRSKDKPTLAFAYSQLGRITFKRSDFKSSNRYFERAIELDPDHLDFFGMYAESLYWQKDYVGAEALFKQAMQVAPNDHRFQLMLGRTLAEQKQYLHGQRYLKQALGEQGAYEELARIYHDHREYEMAALAASKARESHTRQVAAVAAVAAASGVGHSTGGESGNPNTGYAATHPALGQPTNSIQVSQVPQSVPPQTVPQQTVAQQYVQRQTQMTAAQPVILPQQAGLQQQVPIQQQVAIPQNGVPQYHLQPYQAQQPVPQYQAQQQMMPANVSHPQIPSQNFAPMNPANPMSPTAVQQGPYPVSALPQQASEANPQHQPENRPPYGFASMEQLLPTNPPMTGMQAVPGQTWQNGQEIAYHPNYAAPQPGMSQPNFSSPAMPSPTSPYAENQVPTWQTPTWAP